MFPTPEALTLMAEAIQDERSDELFYDALAAFASNETEKKIILSIRDDEHDHVEIFRQMYYAFTGQIITPTDKPLTKPESYVQAIKTGILAEIEAVESYNKIYLGIPDLWYRSLLSEIIADELKHLGQFNFIYTEIKTSPPTA